MEVYLTVDTECTEERLIRNVIRPPVGYDLMMRGRVAGRERGLGTELIVDELRQFDFQATFFVEALCAEHFGIDGLASVCGDLLSAGQDVQLHLHPNFRKPEWRHRGEQPLADNIGEYDRAAQEQLLRTGIDILERAGVPRASVRAFRAGNYGAGNDVWMAMQKVGLAIDSSLNLCYIGRSCMIVPDAPRIDLYEPIEGVWELPISCFAEGSTYRHLEITAISSTEMIKALQNLKAAGAATATIVTHPGEFFFIDDHARRKGRPNRINVLRLRRLLAFLDKARDRFEVRTVGSLAHELEAGTKRVAIDPVQVPSGSAMLRLARMPAQAVKRLIA